jgi:nitroreductase
MDAIQVIKTRRSIRVYQKRAVPRDVLTDIVDCARLAPTAMNQQQWDFVVVTHSDLTKKLGEVVGHAKFLPDTPACIVVLCGNNTYYVEDGSAATQNILLAAHAHGLGSCWVACEKQSYADEIRKAVGAPEGLKAVAICTLGYPAEEPKPDKRPLDSVLHWEKY